VVVSKGYPPSLVAEGRLKWTRGGSRCEAAARGEWDWGPQAPFPLQAKQGAHWGVWRAGLPR